MMTPPSRASQLPGSIELRGRRNARREPGPEGRDALGFTSVGPELLFGIQALPAATALEFTDMRKPSLCERVPFLDNPIKADSALPNRHWVPPALAKADSRTTRNASTTTESCTKTTAYREIAIYDDSSAVAKRGES
jgi:hypothetical protein